MQVFVPHLHSPALALALTVVRDVLQLLLSLKLLWANKFETGRSIQELLVVEYEMEAVSSHRLKSHAVRVLHCIMECSSHVPTTGVRRA